MGFFQDLKEDLSQAVNELVEEETTKEEAEQEGMQEEAAVREEIAQEESMSEVIQEITDHEEEVIQEVTEPEEELPMDKEELEALLQQNDRNLYGYEPEEVEEAEETMEEEFTKIQTEYMGANRMMETGNENKNKEMSDETAVITKGMTVNGDLSSQGSVDIIGTVEGNIDILGKLNVTGVIRGNSQASEIYAESARITGEVVSEGSVKIGQSSVVIGNIMAISAVIAGAVKGDIDVQGPVVLDASAIVMGNIKSKSVQINNGAVIEGLCSQCYADVNPSNFFDEIK